MLAALFCVVAVVDPAGGEAVVAPVAVAADIVVDLVALGVDDAVAAQTTSALAAALARSLPSKTVTSSVDAAGAVVVRGSVQLVGGRLVVVAHAPGVDASGDVDEVAAALAAALRSTTTQTTTTTTTTTTQATTLATGAAHPDELLLLLDYGLLLVGGLLPGGFLFLPFVQGLLHDSGGPQLVHNRYPNWLSGVVAGYVAFAVGAAVLVGAVAFATFAAATSGSDVANVIGVSGVVVGVAVVAAEPAVVWAFARDGAVSSE